MSLELFANRSVPAPPRAGLYASILADPPWPEQGGGEIKRGADRHYGLMSVEDIALLPVTFWAAPDAHLYMWVTNNYLERWSKCDAIVGIPLCDNYHVAEGTKRPAADWFRAVLPWRH